MCVGDGNENFLIFFPIIMLFQSGLLYYAN